MLVLRPLGGTEDEVAAVYVPLEPVEPAHFELPDPEDVGDHRRLGCCGMPCGSGSGRVPVRFGRSRRSLSSRDRTGVAPLLMGLQLDPVRILIADDVGIGKTVEAGLLARERFDRAEIQRPLSSALRTWPSSGRRSCMTAHRRRACPTGDGHPVGAEHWRRRVDL
ncbi:MAG: hypothetical protein R3A46_12670 [Thermomicrobiales bacterium]